MFLDTPRLVSIAVITGLFYKQLSHVQTQHMHRDAVDAESRYITAALPFA